MGKTLTCDSNHVFDVARQGYVNLLGRPAPANADTAEMVAARERFLGGRHYEPITAAVADAVHTARRLLEVGAGTGHHLANILERLPEAHGLASDVSVPASRRSARAQPRMAAVVADTWSGLPLRDGSVDAVLCVFAPRNPAEFARVLSPSGVLVVVIPRPDHMKQLRISHSLLDIHEEKSAQLLSSMEDRFILRRNIDIAFEMDLSAEATTDLVAMGPNGFHTDASFSATSVGASVSCLTFTRR